MGERALALGVLFLLMQSVPLAAFAAEGTILDSAKYAWGENMGWINFAPAPDGTYEGLVITDSSISGFAWSTVDGWINFSPDAGGVTNTPDGTLGGYAWSQNVGWISMSGATIDSNGQFHGVAGSADSSSGRITFDCTSCDVATDWRPASATTLQSNHSSYGSSISTSTKVSSESGPAPSGLPGTIEPPSSAVSASGTPLIASSGAASEMNSTSTSASLSPRTNLINWFVGIVSGLALIFLLVRFWMYTKRSGT